MTAEALHDTSMSPVLFATGEDRRAGARVPLSRPVRVGPVNGAPEALVSARDLSVGGMFVDADRPVRVGARFSVELDLPDGGPVYVCEAEVAYNREHVHGTGFGVRFVNMHPEASHAIAAEVTRQTAALFDGEDDAHPLISDLPTLAPTPAEPAPALSQAAIATDQVRQRPRTEVPTEVEVQAEPAPLPETVHPEPVDEAPSLPPEPDLLSDLPSPSAIPAAVDADEDNLPFAARMKARLQGAPEVIARGAPGILLLAGLLAVIVVALLAWMDGVSPNQAVAAPVPAAVDSTTYDYMQGKSGPPEVRAPRAATEAPTSKAVKRKLPPAVAIESLVPPEKKATKAKAEAPKAKAEAPKAEAAPVNPKPSAPAAKAPAKPHKPHKALSPAARALLGESAPNLVVPLKAGAKIRKSYVLHDPERFVVDVVGHEGPLAVPAVSGAVQKIRTGRHPGFVRMVVDVDGTLESAVANRTEAGLELQLRLR